MNYHTSFHPRMQNDNGWTVSGHQVVCCVPQIDRRGLLNGLKPVRKEFAFVLMSLEGVSQVSPPASNTFCTTVVLSEHCGTLCFSKFQECREQAPIQSRGAER